LDSSYYYAKAHTANAVGQKTSSLIQSTRKEQTMRKKNVTAAAAEYTLNDLWKSMRGHLPSIDLPGVVAASGTIVAKK